MIKILLLCILLLTGCAEPAEIEITVNPDQVSAQPVADLIEATVEPEETLSSLLNKYNLSIPDTVQLTEEDNKLVGSVYNYKIEFEEFDQTADELLNYDESVFSSVVSSYEESMISRKNYTTSQGLKEGLLALYGNSDSLYNGIRTMYFTQDGSTLSLKIYTIGDSLQDASDAVVDVLSLLSL